MNLNIDKLPKWQQKVILQAVKDAETFISNKYNIDCFDLVTLQPSNTCRFAKYSPSVGKIRLELKRDTIHLYERKTLGKYQTTIKSVGFLVSYTSQLIHELTHFIQDLENRCFSEVETTQNELEYLKSINIINQ